MKEKKVKRQHSTPVERYKQLQQHLHQPQSYYELVTLTGISLAHVKKLLLELEKAGCVTRQTIGKFTHFSWIAGMPAPMAAIRDEKPAPAPIGKPCLDPISAAMFPAFWVDLTTLE